MEEKYLILLKKSEVVEDIEGQVKAMFGKLEYTDKVVKNLGDLQIMKQMEQLKIDITNIEKWSSLISSKRKQLEGNVTNLQEAVAQIEFSTAAIAKEVSMKIKAVQTDVRRISGLEPYVQVLTESVQELEEKLAKVERKTVESIGGMLAGSIDRISSLKSSVSRNSNHIDLIKEKLFQLRGNLSENSEQLLNLESDRLKVMKAVNFANDLKPKVFTLRKDFQNLDNMINELSLRIGRLASDLLSREEDITLLNDKLYNLTLIKSAILDLNDKISHL
ncbi:inhibitor of nuclear factor kappa-B kinase-interacting protein [Xenopus tropicalis]|eukprot:NP_001072413.1 inhibitor of nuclear factor kappa-B kinase-interacting protein [Xenopus tropicalis]